MNPITARGFLLAAACAALLSACQRDDEPQVSNGQPMPTGVPVQIQVGPTKDPSLPDASAVAAQLAADKVREEALAQSQPPSQTPAHTQSDAPLAGQSSALSTQAQEPSKVN